MWSAVQSALQLEYLKAALCSCANLSMPSVALTAAPCARLLLQLPTWANNTCCTSGQPLAWCNVQIKWVTCWDAVVRAWPHVSAFPQQLAAKWGISDSLGVYSCCLQQELCSLLGSAWLLDLHCPAAGEQRARGRPLAPGLPPLRAALRPTSWLAASSASGCSAAERCTSQVRLWSGNKDQFSGPNQCWQAASAFVSRPAACLQALPTPKSS